VADTAGRITARVDGGGYREEVQMVLLRRVLGDVLRARRQAQHRTLRDVSGAANVSLGYLSEIERGQKEASSELLAAICDALGAELSELLREVSDTLELAELAEATPIGDGAAVTDLVDSGGSVSAGAVAVGDRVTVAVHHDGPFKTTLRATRNSGPTAGQRREVVHAA
jgi:transcriptional regulator with XRE-family HTH domain